MPFQSEKQRRYLWANEPEIARDWTDTYGSRIKKNNGGLPSIRQPYGGGGDVIQMIIKNILMKQARKKGEELGYFPESTQKKGIGSFLGRILATMFLGPMGGLAFDAGSGFMRKRGSSFAPGSFTNPFSRGSPQDQQNRINMKRQSDIIKTFQNGKYAPGWKEKAFGNLQKLGKNLNLVDAADVGLTKTAPVKKTITPRHAPHPDRGGGGGGYSHPGSAASRASSDPFFRGGLAGLWPR